MAEVNIIPLHVGISVADIEASVKWYREFLGFETVYDTYMPPLKARLVFMRNGDFELELFEHDESIPLPPGRLLPNSDIQTQGTKHVCFAHPDVTSFLTDMKSRGVDVVLGPQVMPDGKTMGFIRDNNGTLIEFIQTDK